MKHTAGPWKIGSENTYAQDEIEGPAGNCVALVWTRTAKRTGGPRSNWNDDPQGKANAHLIEAAPELLEALKAFCMDHTSPCGCENCRIISKAEGTDAPQPKTMLRGIAEALGVDAYQAGLVSGMNQIIQATAERKA